MVKVTVSPTGEFEGEPVEVYGVQLIEYDFLRGSVRIHFNDEGGPHVGEYALDAVEIDYEAAAGTQLIGRSLTTYQLRAINNLPPVLPGAPDYTFEPAIPKYLKPTDTKMPPEELGGDVSSTDVSPETIQ